MLVRNIIKAQCPSAKGHFPVEQQSVLSKGGTKSLVKQIPQVHWLIVFLLQTFNDLEKQSIILSLVK